MLTPLSVRGVAATETFDNDVRLELYRFFVENARPPVAAELATKLGARPIEVEQSLRRMHDAHVLVLAPSTPYVWMANPFSAVPTPYRAHVGDKSYFGSCIWDSLGIVAFLGGTGRVVAKCGDCGEDLAIEVRDGDLHTTGYLVHYAVPAAQWWDDIGFN